MKKIIALILLAALFMAGCPGPKPWNTTASPTYSVPTVELDEKYYSMGSTTGTFMINAWAQENKTINTVESSATNLTGSWSACTRTSTNWEEWACGNPYIRITQNEYPGTAFYTFFVSIPTYVYPNSFCGAEECTYSGGTLAAGTYTARKITFASGNTIINGNVSLLAWEAVTINSGATITFTSSITTPPYTLNISTYNFTDNGGITGDGAVANPGAISGAGNPCRYNAPPYTGTLGAAGATLIVNAAHISFGGANAVSLRGGAGDDGKASCCSSSSCSSTCGATSGGVGGSVYLYSTHPIVNISIAFDLTGGRGGNSAACTSFGSTCSSSAPGAHGGSLFVNGLLYTNNNVVYTDGGAGGNAGCAGHACCSGSNGGIGGNNNFTVGSNISASNTHRSSGGAAGSACSTVFCGGAAGSAGANGAWNVSYCSNGTGMDWSKFSPSAVTSAATCLTRPAPTFITPNATSNYVPAAQNITTNVSGASAEMRYVLQYSRDNGTTWYTLSMNNSKLFPPIYSSSTYTLYSHGEATTPPNMHIFRMLAYNSTSQISSDWIYTSNFNVTSIATNVSGYTSPNGTVATPAVTFYCNYTNATGYQLSNPTAYVLIDGSLYAMTYDSVAKLWYYTNNQSWVAGPHTWSCVMSRMDFASQNTTLQNLALAGVAVILPAGYTNVTLYCIFPTVSNRQPAGQTTGRGIFNVRNYNDTALQNYTLYSTKPLPLGISISARCDRWTTNPTGWTLLSNTTGFLGITNLNSSNTTAYCWLKMDCINVEAGQAIDFGYNFTQG